MTLFREKCFDLLAPPQGPRVYIRTEYVLVCALCSISFNLICNITTFRKKCFDPPRDRVYTSFPLIWYATWTHSEKKEFWPFDRTPRIEGMCKDSICVCMAPYALFPLIWYATWILSEKIVDLLTWLNGLMMCAGTEHVHAWSSMLNSL